MIDWNNIKEEIKTPAFTKESREFIKLNDEWQDVSLDMNKKPATKWFKFVNGTNVKVDKTESGAKSKHYLFTTDDKILTLTYTQFLEFLDFIKHKDIPLVYEIKVKIGIENGKPKIKFKQA
jgi:hypothetical protein